MRLVIISSVEVGVVLDGEDLLEEKEAIEDGVLIGRGDGDHFGDSLWKEIGEGQGAEPTNGGPDDCVKALNL